MPRWGGYKLDRATMRLAAKIERLLDGQKPTRKRLRGFFDELPLRTQDECREAARALESTPEDVAADYLTILIAQRRRRSV